MTLFVCPAGMSVGGGPRRFGESALDYGARIEGKISADRAATDGNRLEFLYRLSAETHGLARAGCGDGDKVLLLASDTDDGEQAARRLTKLVEAEFGAMCTVTRVSGLRVDKGDELRKSGFANLIRAARAAVEAEGAATSVFNVSGGFKGVVPYMTLLGMILKVETVYVFDGSEVLIRLPPMPIRFDEALLGPFSAALAALHARGMMNRDEFMLSLAPNLRRREDLIGVLIERDEDDVSPSAVGALALGALIEEAEVYEVKLHPAALKGSGFAHKRTPAVLAAMRIPANFAYDRHCCEVQKIVGMKVWKTITSGGVRALYWIEDGVVYVAELLHHEDYDEIWQVKGADRASYPVREFTPYLDGRASSALDCIGEAVAQMQETMADDLERLRSEADQAKEELAVARKSRDRAKRAAQGAEAAAAATPLVMRAAAFAARAHRDHRRKDESRTPYVNHLIFVTEILTDAGVRDPQVLAAAFLHDAIEDLGVTGEEIEQNFGPNVRRLVEMVTDDKSLAPEVRKRLQVEDAPFASADCAAIKLADKIANLRDLAVTPPADWSRERRADYLRWAGDVAEGLKGREGPGHKRLGELFDEAHAAASRVLADVEPG